MSGGDKAPVRSVAVIGVGAMGAPMVGRLICAGFEVTVCDRSSDRLEPFRGVARTTADAVECGSADAVLVLVNTADQVRGVLRGPGGLLSSIAPGAGTPVVVMSTVSPGDLIALEAEVSAAGGVLVDAPVSGGELRAEEGDLTIMCGGSSRVVQRLSRVFAACASQVFHCGSLGAGATVKALNNTLNTLTSLAMAEVVHVGRIAGIEPAMLARVLEVSTGRNVLTVQPEDLQPYFALHSRTPEVWESVRAMFAKDAAVAKGLVSGVEHRFPLLDAIPELLGDLGGETYETWRVASGESTAPL